MDKVYVSTPTKIAILDHEKKRTFVLRKDGLPDAGETLICCFIKLWRLPFFPFMLRRYIIRVLKLFYRHNRMVRMEA